MLTYRLLQDSTQTPEERISGAITMMKPIFKDLADSIGHTMKD